MDWAQGNGVLTAGILAAGALLGGLFWRVASRMFIKWTAVKFVKTIDYILEEGDDDVDALILQAVKILEKKIPDGVTENTPIITKTADRITGKIPFLLKHVGEIRQFLVEILRTLDNKAKSILQNQK